MIQDTKIPFIFATPLAWKGQSLTEQLMEAERKPMLTSKICGNCGLSTVFKHLILQWHSVNYTGVCFAAAVPQPRNSNTYHRVFVCLARLFLSFSPVHLLFCG